jgi:hypothetical protein
VIPSAIEVGEAVEASLIPYTDPLQKRYIFLQLWDPEEKGVVEFE